MRSILGGLSLLFALFLALPGDAQAQSLAPEAVVRSFNETLIDVMKNGPKLGFKGRVDKLRPSVGATYDMASMTKSTLGTAASKLTPEEAAKLADTYSAFSVATYAAQFDEWDGERFEVGEPRAAAAGSTIVPSWIVPKAGDATQIDYVMRQDQGQWKVIDVLFDGTVSQVAVRRSEFVSIFRARGFTGLIETIEKQTVALEKK
ncbi:MAG: ABC transporter substrate-binding protein [Magnetospirillum sp.]|nr:ABC transporter substrate-binding protein [Magnetospirillum sp.]MBI3708012.1 ABC transporter substrate-binding protein [Pseudomonadota bacterium]